MTDSTNKKKHLEKQPFAKIVATIAMLFFVVVALSNTTYIPTYRSYLHIVIEGDTVAVENNLDTLELTDPGGMFSLRLDHEDVTKEKVKAIKRMKRAAGWATFAAVMTGISSAFSSNNLDFFIRSESFHMASDLTSIYKANANDEKTLEIDLWIDNTSDHELMVCDMERGLTWWVLPRQSMQLKLNNPEASTLRISDPQSKIVRYASAVVGSKVTKWEIDIETDDYWFGIAYKDSNKPHEDANISHYIRISKTDYVETKMKKEDYWALKRSLKKK